MGQVKEVLREDKIYLCDSCGGNIDYNPFSFYHNCSDCGQTFNDESLDIMDKYGCFEVWEEN